MLIARPSGSLRSFPGGSVPWAPSTRPRSSFGCDGFSQDTKRGSRKPCEQGAEGQRGFVEDGSWGCSEPFALICAHGGVIIILDSTYTLQHSVGGADGSDGPEDDDSLDYRQRRREGQGPH